MSILSRYIIRTHIAPFLFGVCTVMFVFLMQFLINFLPALVGKGLGVWIITQLIALNLAWMLTLAIPMGILLSSLMAFGNLSASNEITIIKSGGGGLMTMMLPMLITGALMTLALYWFNDQVLPDTNYRAQMLMVDIQRKKPTFIVDKGQFSTQLDGYSILARNIDTTQGLMLGVTIYDNTSLDQMNVVSADTGRLNFSSDYAKMVLLLTNGEIHQIRQQNYGDYRRIMFEQHRIILDASGFAFARTDEKFYSRGDRTMKIADMRGIVQESERGITAARAMIQQIAAQQSKELRGERDSLKKTIPAELPSIAILGATTQTIQSALRTLRTKKARPNKATVQPALPSVSLPTTPEKLPTRKEAAWRAESRIAGFYSALDASAFQIRERENTANKYLVEIHKKYVIPAACFIFVLIGCPLGIMTRRGNFGISGAITLVFYVIYYLFLAGGEKLADRGFMQPWLAMWLADIVLGTFGIFLMMRVEKDLPLADVSPLYRVWRRFGEPVWRRMTKSRSSMSSMSLTNSLTNSLTKSMASTDAESLPAQNVDLS
jgi:lipopolysaccharide export system permease protein